MKKLFIIIPLIALLCFGIYCQKQDKEEPEKKTRSAAVSSEEVEQKNATGTFTFNDEAVEIKYVYTWYESSLLDSTVTSIHLVFSDNPVPNKTQSIFDLQDLGREGKIRGLMLAYSTGDMYKDSIVGGNIFHEDIGNRSVAFGGGWIEVELTNYDDTVMEGRIFTQETKAFLDYKFEVNVSFKALLPDM